MIVVKLYGGLGNQMFQYAAAKSLAVKSKTSVQYEGEYFRNPEKFGSAWSYQLNLLQTDCQEWQPPIPQAMIDFYFRIVRKIQNKTGLFKKRFFLEKPFTFDARFQSLGKNVFLDGYFQSEQYFQDIRDILLQEFQPRVAVDDTNAQLAKKMREVSSVSVHFRRGDYVSNPSAAQAHGICDLNYYAKAVALMGERVPNAHFFVFSDEPDWVRENFKISNPDAMTIVSHNSGHRSYLDMYLMSQCKHNITANSSFSWWGAWLNQNSQKAIIAPQRWYQDTKYNADAMIPKNWIRI